MIKKAAVKLKTDATIAPAPVPIPEPKESPKKGGIFGESKATVEPVPKKHSFSVAPELVKEDKPKGLFDAGPKESGLFGNAPKPAEPAPTKTTSLFANKDSKTESLFDKAAPAKTGSLFANMESK